MKTKTQTAVFVLWLLSFAVVATIYLAWAIYPLENSYLHLSSQVGLSFSVLWKNMNQLMRYLTLPWVTKLVMSDFPSSHDGLAHFRDVKHLFHLAQAVFVLGLIPAIRFLKSHLKAHSLWIYRRLFLGLIGLPFVVAVFGALIGFDQFFTLFHHVLFPGATNWLFNPYTDPIIWVLPEEYFLHCFLIFFGIYELLMLGCFLASRKSYQLYQKGLRSDEK